MRMLTLKLPIASRILAADRLNPANKNPFTTSPLKWLSSCSSIRQKIGFGFGAIISVATLGTLTGHLVEGFYHDKAISTLTRVSQDATHLANLKTTLLQLHLHEHQFASLNMKAEKFEREYAQLVKEISKLEQILAENRSILNTLDSKITISHEEKIHKQLREFIAKNQGDIATYSQHIQELLQQIKPHQMTPEQLQQAQKKFQIFVNSEVAAKFDRVSDRANQLAEDFAQEQANVLINFKEADRLKTLIIFSSLIISAATASIMAFWLNRAIARPLEFTTAVAQRFTQTTNFKLIAPVTTNDEVGRLATSLNQMIESIAKHTQELQQAQTHLIQAEKMAGLGQMVAGIAHEINNPVNFIYGNLSYTNTYVQDLLNLLILYQEQYPNSTPKIDDYIENIDFNFLIEDLPKTLSSMKVGTERIRQLVLSLRNFSRLDESEVKDVNLHEGIDSTLLILNNLLQDKIEIIKDYGNLPPVECYPAQLNQVFMNILSNASDALVSQEDRGNKIIVIETKQLTAAQVQVRIRDNGGGITPEIQSKIFDPFFTTKPVGKGTGLGLSICYQIIKKHHGSIQVNSQAGEGTEFVILLPIAQQCL